MPTVKTIVGGVLFAALLAAPFCAMAGKVCFGAGEQIHHVTNVPLKDGAGNDLAIARKFTNHCFLFPYYQRDDGFVLTLQNDSKKYYPFPSDAEVQRLQLAGVLPQPLPIWETGILQRIFEGNLLWCTIGLTLILAAFQKFKQRNSKNAA